MSTSMKPVSLDASIRNHISDSLERAAKEAGYTLVRKYLSCEVGDGFTIVTAPIAREEVPTEKELSTGVDLLYSYVAIPDAKKLKPGFYRIRIATSGFNFKQGVKVSFLNSEGKAVYSFQGKAAPSTKENQTPNPDEFVARTIRVYGEVCGRKKCFTFTRHGFGDWTFACTDARTGQVIDCFA
jgi:hypothetical protein